jgi:hypothetical protein
MLNVTLFEYETTAWQASKICDLRSAFAEATADGLPTVDCCESPSPALIANCRGEALEINPLEIFGT